MEKSFVSHFFMTNGKFFPSDKLAELNQNLEASDKSEYIVGLSYRNATLFTILYWFLPFFWVIDRFILRDPMGGLLKLFFPILGLIPIIPPVASLLDSAGLNYGMFTMVILIAWWIWVFVDGCTIYGRTKRANYAMLKEALGLRHHVTHGTPVFSASIIIVSLGLSVTLGFLGHKGGSEEGTDTSGKNRDRYSTASSSDDWANKDFSHTKYDDIDTRLPENEERSNVAEPNTEKDFDFLDDDLNDHQMDDTRVESEKEEAYTLFNANGDVEGQLNGISEDISSLRRDLKQMQTIAPSPWDDSLKREIKRLDKLSDGLDVARYSDSPDVKLIHSVQKGTAGVRQRMRPIIHAIDGN